MFSTSIFSRYFFLSNCNFSKPPYFSMALKVNSTDKCQKLRKNLWLILHSLHSVSSVALVCTSPYFFSTSRRRYTVMSSFSGYGLLLLELFNPSKSLKVRSGTFYVDSTFYISNNANFYISMACHLEPLHQQMKKFTKVWIHHIPSVSSIYNASKL